MHTAQDLTDKLSRALAPTEIEIVDESDKHRGHKGSSGGGHYSIRIVSRAFEGKGLVARHRIVYDVLAEEMTGGVHALALRTLTPDEASAETQARAASS
jgi:BolA family transcriptional regulator, general stress-responsive regulator